MASVHSAGAETAFEPEWEDPADARDFWFRDVMHHPAPITPLNATLYQKGFSDGATRTISQFSMPVVGVQAGVHHGYVYLCGKPFVGTPEEMAQRFAAMQRITLELCPTILEDWRETFEPEVLDLADKVLSFDYENSSIAQVAQQVLGLRDLLARIWEIHMRVNIPVMNAVFGLEEFITQVLGADAVAQARQLLQGFDNKSVEMGRALWEMSRWIRATPGLADAVGEAVVRDGQLELRDHPAIGEFRERWTRFLETYGWRSDVFMEIGHPSWREDPSSALVQLKNYLRRPDEQDPFAAHARQGAERDRLAAEFEAKLPGELRPQFRGMLKMAQQYIPIAEDHNFTIDQKFTMVCRVAALELGKRLAADGVLANPDDVFYLVYDEIGALAQGASGEGFAEKAKQRRQERIAQARLNPPPFLGTPPPADLPPNPLVTKFFGIGVVQGSDPKVVTGHPCSAGVVTGVAKVVMTLDEADKIEPGDILVCPMTMPAWTPLFGVVAAVVADSGGPLSHCAIVAREYGIPCVAGTGVGTRTIRDGARVRVDGTTGTVHLLDERSGRG